MQSRSPRTSARIMDSIRRVVRVLRISSRAAEKAAGLSSAQLFVLQALSGEESLSVNELAGRTLTHQSSVSVVVSRLVEQGLVARQKSREDARRVQLSLTSFGRKALLRSPRTPQEQLLDGLAKMPEEHRLQLAERLTELIEASGLAGEPASLFFEDETPRKRKK